MGNSITTRVDKELKDLIKKMSEDNDISERRASKEIAKIVKSNKIKQGKINIGSIGF